MPHSIMDGTGKGYSARVDSDNRLQTKAVTVTELTAATEDALTFIGTSDFVTLTDTSDFSGVFYIKNTTEDKDFHIESVRTCNDSFTYWRVKTNPTGGTLLSSGTSTTLSNGSLGNSFTPSSTVLAGANQLTVTGATLLGTHMQGAGHSVQEFKGGLDITPGQSISFEAKPSSSGLVCLQIIGFVKTSGTI